MPAQISEGPSTSASKQSDEVRQDKPDETSTVAPSTVTAELCTFQEAEGWHLHFDRSVAEHVPQAKFYQLVSSQSASSGILEWTLYLDGAADCWFAGVVPEAMAAKKPDFLMQQCKVGVKGTGAGGCKKEQFTMDKQFLRVVCDLDRSEVAFFVGASLDSLTQRSKQSLKQASSMRLAVGIASLQSGQVRLVSAADGQGGGDFDPLMMIPLEGTHHVANTSSLNFRPMM